MREKGRREMNTGVKDVKEFNSLIENLPTSTLELFKKILEEELALRTLKDEQEKAEERLLQAETKLSVIQDEIQGHFDSFIDMINERGLY